jgi:formate dehydrogenase maturation protein FdhE
MKKNILSAECNGYLKVITVFAPTAAEMLALEDLATLHLNYIAQGRGFLSAEARRTSSGWDGALSHCLL